MPHPLCMKYKYHAFYLTVALALTSNWNAAVSVSLQNYCLDPLINDA